MRDRVRVRIIGAGGWGTALAVHLARGGVAVCLTGRCESFLEELARTRENRKYLPGVAIPEGVLFGDRDPSELTVVAVPTQHIRSTFAAIPRSDAAYLSVAKGLEMGTRARPTEILRELYGEVPAAVLSGPSHAEEVARGLPATLVAASKNGDLARHVQELFRGETLRIYTSEDVVGVEFGGALKNVIAIAAGVCEGLGLGDNAKAALVTRGLAEIARLGEALGAHRGTFAGVSGMGDLITSCWSRHGRNLRVGREIAQGRTLEGLLAEMSMVAEGVWTSRVALALAEEHEIEMPITAEVVRILFEGKSPREAVRDLMKRDPKAELD